jgi:hypothetical protein
MTLQPQQEFSIPEETARVARAVYPKGNLYRHMRDAGLKPCGRECVPGRAGRRGPGPAAGATGLPQLQGYVATTPKPAAQVVLISNLGGPVLTVWQYGLGRVVAWTSDALGLWTADWLRWGQPRAGGPTWSLGRCPRPTASS